MIQAAATSLVYDALKTEQEQALEDFCKVKTSSYLCQWAMENHCARH